MGKSTNVRAEAIRLLSKLEGEGAGYSNLLFRGTDGMSDEDRALLRRLVYGVTERRITLDYIISRLSSRPLEKLEGEVLLILRLGIYQLRYADRIPPHAAINETVALCRPSYKGFVNAILRSYQRTGDSLELPPRKRFPKYLSVTYSIPTDTARALIDDYGEERAEAILASFSEVPPITLRVNTLKTTRKELMRRLTDEGFCVKETEYSPVGIRVLGGGLPDCVTDGSGLAFVQDEASELCALALGARRGERLLDTCACPGGKSFSAAMEMQNEGSVLSCDLHESKLPLISENAARLGINIITAACRDASSPCRDDERESFDRVLCDVPCSGLGVIAKKPEIRYKSLDAMRLLPPLQYSILTRSAECLRLGGVLVYSTCTVLRAENEENVERFLSEHPEFSLEPFSVGGLSVPSGMITLTPEKYPTDGFFIAKLRKNM